MGYTGIPYKIEPGDTLWDIAARKLGDHYAWPRLYAFNNQPDVIAAGAKRIVDPDLIYAGSVMMLPIVKCFSPATLPSLRAAPAGRLRDQIPSIQMPMTFAYELKGDAIVLDYGTFIARIRQKGRVMLNLGTKMPLTAVLNGGLELSGKVKAESTFGKLISENKISLDPNTKNIKFSNKLISSSNNIHAPKTAIGFEMSSSTGMAVLKCEIKYPEVKGTLMGDSFVALNYTIEIELEPRKPRVPKVAPIRVNVPVPSPGRAPQTIDWWYVVKTASIGAVIVAGVITVGYGASVVLSGGGTGLAAPAYASAMAVILVGATVTNIPVQ